MPTYHVTARFRRDLKRLNPAERRELDRALAQFINDLRRGGRFRKSLRVRGVQGTAGIFEMTWAVDGRCTFQYGPEVQPGEPHIMWRRCGGHDIFKNP